MTDPKAPPEALTMARRVYANYIRRDIPGATESDTPQFEDSAHGVQIALSAILETTELAAKYLDKRMEQRFSEYGTREPDTNATYYSGRYGETLETLDENDEEIATALRNQEHLP